MKRLCLSLALAVVATLLIVMPVLAAYYAYIYVEESEGNSYESLSASVPCNTTILIQGDFMTSTALDTRVLTGSGEALPHMVADDKVMFVTDLGAYEKKTLIFYLGGTSLSSFPIIVGYNGSFVTPDDPDLELGYVMELLISGYFNAEAADVGHNILYKEDAFRVWISAANTIKVAAYNSTGDEQWEMHYSSFTTGVHTVYIVCDGLQALLYVDSFDVAKDTVNLYESTIIQIDNDDYYDLYCQRTCSFYAEGLYWAFSDAVGVIDGPISYWTSADGVSWSGEYTISIVSSDNIEGMGVWYRDGYVHISYGGLTTGTGVGKDDYIRYRRGAPNSDSSITWSTDWQTAVTITPSTHRVKKALVSVDSNGYPFIAYTDDNGYGTSFWHYMTESSTNNGTWTTAGGYPWQIQTSGFDRPFFTAAYPNSAKMYLLYSDNSATLKGKYYNGASWSGVADTIGSGNIAAFNAVADNEDNLYIVWQDQISGAVSLRVRYADGSWSSSAVVTNSGYQPNVAYNDDNGYIYIMWIESGYVRAIALANGEVSNVGTLFATSSDWMAATRYGSHIGMVLCKPAISFTYHGYLSFPWVWNDNDNDWYWMQNNVMAYIDDIQVAVDGTLQLEYKPDSIILGTTLPDEENDNNATISWGANPVGVNTSMSALQFEQSYNETYYYQYLSPGSTDIIKPEPGAMGGDVDLVKLHGNPLYPLVQVLTIPGFLTERLGWLILAWLIVIVAMFGVHLGFDTRKDSEKPQHFILTAITGLGLSILFYTVTIFSLWVIILMAFGLVGAILWERQPVI